MAINETVKDITVNPSVSKTVALDMDKVVLIDTEGDEKYVLKTTTSATATGAAPITDIYIREFKAGYSRSSGFKTAPFTISSSNNTLNISIDGSTVREIILEEGTGLSGNNVAEDIQSKIAALAAVAAQEDGNLSFLNNSTLFENGRFTVIAGSLSNTYTGLGRTSVQVSSGSTNDASVTLGFDMAVESEALSSKRAVESTLSTDFTGNTVTLNLTSVEDMNADEAYSITDGTNREYFVADTVTLSGATITVTSGAVANSYASGSVIQRVFERDPEADLASPLEDIDAIYRFGIKSLVNQIDFSS